MSNRRYTLDASALLAIFNNESGSQEVEALLAKSHIGTVNLAEVAAKLSEYGTDDAEIVSSIGEMELSIVSFDERQALRAGVLRRATQRLGLSLGDRACLALAALTSTTVLTADKAWAKLDIGVNIQVIR